MVLWAMTSVTPRQDLEIRHLLLTSHCNMYNVYSLIILIFRKIYLSGHSAGAHLCAMVLMSDWFKNLDPESKSRFNGVFYQSGIFDLRPLLSTSINEPLKMNEESAATLSPFLHLEKFSENFSDDRKEKFFQHMIVGENDSPAFRSQSKSFTEKVSFTESYS